MVTYVLIFNAKGRHQTFRSLPSALACAATVFETYAHIREATILSSLGEHILTLMKPEREGALSPTALFGE